MICEECYSEKNRITPLRNARECLENHTQYICSACKRCICIEKDSIRSLQRWNFPFQSLEAAKLYLRVADYSMKKSCGIYEIKNQRGKSAYKIFENQKELDSYLAKNKDKRVEQTKPIFTQKEFQEYQNTQIRKLTKQEVEKYLKEQLEPI